MASGVFSKQNLMLTAADGMPTEKDEDNKFLQLCKNLFIFMSAEPSQKFDYDSKTNVLSIDPHPSVVDRWLRGAFDPEGIEKICQQAAMILELGESTIKAFKQGQGIEKWEKIQSQFRNARSVLTEDGKHFNPLLEVDDSEIPLQDAKCIFQTCVLARLIWKGVSEEKTFYKGFEQLLETYKGNSKFNTKITSTCQRCWKPLYTKSKQILEQAVSAPNTPTTETKAIAIPAADGFGLEPEKLAAGVAPAPAAPVFDPGMSILERCKQELKKTERTHTFTATKPISAPPDDSCEDFTLVFDIEGDSV